MNYFLNFPLTNLYNKLPIHMVLKKSDLQSQHTLTQKYFFF